MLKLVYFMDVMEQYTIFTLFVIWPHTFGMLSVAPQGLNSLTSLINITKYGCSVQRVKGEGKENTLQWDCGRLACGFG